MSAGKILPGWDAFGYIFVHRPNLVLSCSANIEIIGRLSEVYKSPDSWLCRTFRAEQPLIIPFWGRHKRFGMSLNRMLLAFLTDDLAPVYFLVLI
jgi:hypothetical protein